MKYRITRSRHAWWCAAAWTFTCAAAISSAITVGGAA